MINGQTICYGILGFPVSHSLSPNMHNAIFKSRKKNAVYLPVPLHPDRVQEDLNALVHYFKGLNVTVPHKESVMDFITQLDDGAKQIGAVNTIMNDDGVISGFNTDWLGFRDSLLLDYGVSLKDKHVVILGAGGSARACFYACIAEQAASVKMVNRTLEKAHSLVESFENKDVPITVCGTSEKELEQISNEVDLIVNTTSIGLKKGESHYISEKHLESKPFVYDLIYNPMPTDLIAKAESQGCQVGHGKGMLVRQGAQSSKIWFGVEPEIELMVNACGFKWEQGRIR